MSEAKTRRTGASVQAFLKAVEHPQRREDGFELLEMMKEITNEEPMMWGPSIVGFGSYHYKYESGREGDMPLIGFSPRKRSLSLYITSEFEECTDLLDKLGKHKIGKSCLYINKLADVDKSVLKKMIKKSLKRIDR